MLLLHQLQHVPVADRRAQELEMLRFTEFMKPEVRHDRCHKAL